MIPLFESTVKLQITLLSPSDRAKRDEDKSLKSLNYTHNNDALFDATLSKGINLFCLYRQIELIFHEQDPQRAQKQNREAVL